MRFDMRAGDVAEGVDGDIVGDLHIGAEDHIGLDHHIAPHFGVPAEPHRLGRDQRGAIGHGAGAAALLPARLGLGQFAAAVDARHFVGVVRHAD